MIFVLYAKEDIIYIVESRYNRTEDLFETRILKATLDSDPVTIWPWFKDKWKIGSNGFLMGSDTQVIFAHYPNVYCMDKGEQPKIYFDINDSINKIRPVGNQKILLLSDKNCWLTDQKGTLLKSWKDLPEQHISNAPMGRNTMYDVAYQNGKLLMAYWGKRSFELIDQDGNRKTLKQCKPEWIPHWVSFYGDKALLFSSFMDFETPLTPDLKKSTITPLFELYDKGKLFKIW